MRATVCGLLTCVLSSVLTGFAAEPAISDKFYDAIRRDDAAAVQKLQSAGASVNVKDNRGGTPLMYAATVGSEAMMRRLLDAGADVNAKNAFDATALMLAADSFPLVKLLVEHGADVNARSKAGHTPLELAAAHAGGIDAVKLLLAKGAALAGPPDSQGMTPLAMASQANETATVKLLIEHDAKAAIAGPAGPMAIMNAAMYGNVEIVKLLLSKGVDVNSQSPPETARVKNGPIMIGKLTALILAVADGSPEMVRLLLDSGAKIDMTDVRGMTPLMLSVATDHPNAEVIQILLAHHADPALKSNLGETALDWARKFRNPAVLTALGERAPAAPATLASEKAAAADTRAAVQRSVALLQTSGTTMFREGGCISCHGGNIVTVATETARRKGVRVDEAAAKENLKATRLQFAAQADGMLERTDPPAVEILTYALAAISEEDAPTDRTIDAMLHNLAAEQMATGSWPFGGIMRPPTADSPITNAAWAIRAFQQYAPPARKKAFDERVSRAARALVAVKASTTEDAVMQLLGVKWSGGDPAQVQKLAARVAALQRADGGWAQTPFLGSDAYATGTALHALHETGMAPDAAAYRKGVAFLLRTQAADGSWKVASRTPKFQPYFEGGFPYGHDEWISQWGTGWATVALAQSLPPTSASAQ